MKNKKIFSEHRFVFRGGPERGPAESAAVAPAQKMEKAREVIHLDSVSGRKRFQLLNSRKKVSGEKVDYKDARMLNDAYVLRSNGAVRMAMSITQLVDSNGKKIEANDKHSGVVGDKVTIARGGQVYEMGGQRYLYAKFENARGGKYFAYVREADVVSTEGGTEAREKVVKDLTKKAQREIE